MPYADKEQRKLYHKEYMRERRKTLSQKEYDKAQGQKYRKENWDAIKQQHYSWREANPEEWKRIKRRAERRRETNKKCQYSGIVLVNMLIEMIYDFRDTCNEITGIEHHVDHKIPLSKGGLHVPWNLQVLTATENLKKHNKL